MGALDLLGLGVHLLLPLLSPSAKAKDEVKGGLLLDVVVGKGAPVLELLSGEDETLLVRGDSLLVLDLLLDVVDGVRRLNIEGDGLPGKGLDENLHYKTIQGEGLGIRGNGKGLEHIKRTSGSIEYTGEEEIDRNVS